MIRLLLGGLLLLGTWPCAGQAAEAPGPAVPKPPRLIALSPHATELVFAVGAGADLVGVVAGSDYPAQALSLPVIGDSQRLDRELTLALRPDLAVAWGSGNRQGDLRWLLAQGVRVYRSDPRRLDDIADDLATLGTLAGRRQCGRQAAGAFRARLARLRRHYAGLPPLPAFYALWPAPLMTLGGTALITQAMKVCGLDNLFADQHVESLAIDPESLIARQPRVILVPARTGAAASATPWDREHWPAGAAPAVIQVDPDLIERPGPRMLDAIEQLCRARVRLSGG